MRHVKLSAAVIVAALVVDTLFAPSPAVDIVAGGATGSRSSAPIRRPLHGHAVGCRVHHICHPCWIEAVGTIRAVEGLLEVSGRRMEVGVVKVELRSLSESLESSHGFDALAMLGMMEDLRRTHLVDMMRLVKIVGLRYWSSLSLSLLPLPVCSSDGFGVGVHVGSASDAGGAS